MQLDTAICRKSVEQIRHVLADAGRRRLDDVAYSEPRLNHG